MPLSEARGNGTAATSPSHQPADARTGMKGTPFISTNVVATFWIQQGKHANFCDTAIHCKLEGRLANNVCE